MRASSKKISAAFLCGLFSTCYIGATVGLLTDPTYQGGWEASNDRRVSDTDLVWEKPEWSGNGEGQTRLLYKDWKSVHGTDYQPRNQGKTPACVGYATAAACDFLAAVEIRSGERERAPPAIASAATIYGLSRIEVTGNLTPTFGGSHNIWAAQALHRYGVVPSCNFGLLGYDLSQNEQAQAVKFGFTGVPGSLEKIASVHPVREYIAMDSYEEIRDAIYMGCPVTIGSKVGFGEGKRTRDAEGFLNRPGGGWFNTGSKWNHSMVAIGVCDTGRKGILILNSWGADWVAGPKRFDDEPEGSFWVDAEVIDLMAEYGDSFALRGFQGYAVYGLK